MQNSKYCDSEGEVQELVKDGSWVPIVGASEKLKPAYFYSTIFNNGGNLA